MGSCDGPIPTESTIDQSSQDAGQVLLIYITGRVRKSFLLSGVWSGWAFSATDMELVREFTRADFIGYAMQRYYGYVHFIFLLKPIAGNNNSSATAKFGGGGSGDVPTVGSRLSSRQT
jgi:hypothetical protein